MLYRAILLCLATLFLASAVSGEVVNYVLQVPGVV